jgi:hypothetical protein
MSGMQPSAPLPPTGTVHVQPIRPTDPPTGNEEQYDGTVSGAWTSVGLLSGVAFGATLGGVAGAVVGAVVGAIGGSIRDTTKKTVLQHFSDLSDEQKAALFGVAAQATSSPAAEHGLRSGSGSMAATDPKAMSHTELAGMPAEEAGAEECACKICMSNKVQTIFQPCGHAVACGACAAQMSGRGEQLECPICRASLTSTQRIYL